MRPFRGAKSSNTINHPDKPSAAIALIVGDTLVRTTFRNGAAVRKEENLDRNR